MQLTITSKAVHHIQRLVEKEKNPVVGLRLSVSGGGCSGLKYHFVLDSIINKDDQIFEKEGAKVIVDAMSAGFLENAEIDFIEDMMSSSFVVKNSKAVSSCGCGKSFSI